MTFEDVRTQLEWTPHVEGGVLPGYRHVVVGGMGGSALPGYALRFLNPALPLSVHSDYDLPEYLPEGTLCVATSFSGNTEETLSFAHAAHARGLPLAVVTSGGALLAFAKEKEIPHVLVPKSGQPRDALIYLVHALLACLNRQEEAAMLRQLSVDEEGVVQDAQTLAGFLRDGLPLLYASRANGFLARLAKVMTNETAKMPGFANIFPELNHNEMESFDAPAPHAVVDLARFVLLRDASDDARIKVRMDVFRDCMSEGGRKVLNLPLRGEGRAGLLVENWFLFHLAAKALAEERGVDPEAVPLVEEFKKRLKSRGK